MHLHLHHGNGSIAFDFLHFLLGLVRTRYVRTYRTYARGIQIHFRHFTHDFHDHTNSRKHLPMPPAIKKMAIDYSYVAKHNLKEGNE